MANLERIYTIPLGDAYLRVRNVRAKRAVAFIRAFALRHMKAIDVRISEGVNSLVFRDGMEKPPRRIKVRIVKGEESLARVWLIGEEEKVKAAADRKKKDEEEAKKKNEEKKKAEEEAKKKADEKKKAEEDARKQGKVEQKQPAAPAKPSAPQTNPAAAQKPAAPSSTPLAKTAQPSVTPASANTAASSKIAAPSSTPLAKTAQSSTAPSQKPADGPSAAKK